MPFVFYGRTHRINCELFKWTVPPSTYPTPITDYRILYWANFEPYFMQIHPVFIEIQIFKQIVGVSILAFRSLRQLDFGDVFQIFTCHLEIKAFYRKFLTPSSINISWQNIKILKTLSKQLVQLTLDNTNHTHTLTQISIANCKPHTSP